MKAAAAHRVPERVADGTRTHVWVWITNTCRRRMNRGEGYITAEISQTMRGEGEKEEGERLLGGERNWEFTSSDEESFLPGT